MNAFILILTHLGAAGVGAAVSYLFVRNRVKVVDHDGHTALEITPEEERVKSDHPLRTPGLWFALLGVVAVVVGTQTLLGKQAEADSDRRDAEYATCIRDYAQEAAKGIVDTIEIRNAANAKVAAAEVVRDDAVDRILMIVGEFRRTPPTATEAEFDRALVDQRVARERLQEERRAAAMVKDDNSYEDAVPEPECVR